MELAFRSSIPKTEQKLRSWPNNRVRDLNHSLPNTRSWGEISCAYDATTYEEEYVFGETVERFDQAEGMSALPFPMAPSIYWSEPMVGPHLNGLTPRPVHRGHGNFLDWTRSHQQR